MKAIEERHKNILNFSLLKSYLISKLLLSNFQNICLLIGNWESIISQ